MARSARSRSPLLSTWPLPIPPPAYGLRYRPDAARSRVSALSKNRGGGIVERLLSKARCGDDQGFRRQRVGGSHRCSGACREGDRHDENAQDLAHPNCSFAYLLRSKSLRIVFNGTKRDGQDPVWIIRSSVRLFFSSKLTSRGVIDTSVRCRQEETHAP